MPSAKAAVAGVLVPHAPDVAFQVAGCDHGEHGVLRRFAGPSPEWPAASASQGISAGWAASQPTRSAGVRVLAADPR